MLTAHGLTKHFGATMALRLLTGLERSLRPVNAGIQIITHCPNSTRRAWPERELKPLTITSRTGRQRVTGVTEGVTEARERQVEFTGYQDDNRRHRLHAVFHARTHPFATPFDRS